MPISLLLLGVLSVPAAAPSSFVAGNAPVDLLLLMACAENDTPKVEELLGAGADPTVKDLNGQLPIELCQKEEIKAMLGKALASAK